MVTARRFKEVAPDKEGEEKEERGLKVLGEETRRGGEETGAHHVLHGGAGLALLSSDDWMR